MRIVLAALVALGVVAGQVFLGGAGRTILSLPTFFLVGIAGVLVLPFAFMRRAVSPNFAAVASVFLLAGYLGIRSWTSSGDESSLYYTLLVLACATAYYVMAVAVTTPAARYTFFCIILFAAVVQAIVAAIQFSSEKPFFPVVWLSEQLRGWYADSLQGGVRRSQGLYLSGNQLAWMLNIAALFALLVSVFGRTKLWLRILFAYFAAVCVAGTVLSVSRGGILGLAAGLVVFCLLVIAGLAVGARDRRLHVAVALVAVTLLTFGGGYAIFQGSDAVRVRLERIGEDTYRTELWRTAWRQVQIDPLQGCGAGSFSKQCRTLAAYLRSINDTYAHNDWLQTVTDFGFFGALAAALALICNMRSGLAGYFRVLGERMATASRPESNSAAFLAAALSSTVACAVHSFFDYNMQIASNAVLAAACLGMLANSGLPGKQRSTLGAATRVFATLLSAGFACILLLIIGTTLSAQVGTLRAENYLLTGHFSEARLEGEEVLKRGGDNSRLRRVVGEACLREGEQRGLKGWLDYLSAVGHLQEATRLDPGERWNYLLSGMAYAKLDDYPHAKAAHLEAIRLDPSSALMHEYYGLSLETLGKLDEAMDTYAVSLQFPGGKFSYERLAYLRERSRPR